MAERGKKPGKHRAFDETSVTKTAAMVIARSTAGRGAAAHG
jgi:hypothetical protein